MRISLGNLGLTRWDANGVENLCYDKNRPWWLPYGINTSAEDNCLATGIPGAQSGSGETPYELPGLPGGTITTEDPISAGWGVEGVDWTWTYWNPETNSWQDDPYYPSQGGATPINPATGTSRVAKKKDNISTSTLVMVGAALMILMIAGRR